ncbi:MAG: METTL5 family protein [Halobacteriaceae archaeon]
MGRAALEGDLDRPVLDLGAGTGVLAVGAALRGARAVGVEADPGALAVAVENAAAAGVAVEWVLGDATRAPLCPPDPVTVLMNPPFGAQDGNEGADARFLRTAAGLAAVSYSVHNAGSRGFVEAFADDHGGAVTHAFTATVSLDRRFPFHEADSRDIEVEVFRIEWTPE